MQTATPTVPADNWAPESYPLPEVRTKTDRSVFLINFRNHRDLYPPFGIMYVADALMQAGFDVKLFHETEDFTDTFLEEVAETEPLFVGFSTITGPQLKPTIDASHRVHEMGIPVVWGGVHATIMPLDVLQEDYVDFVIVNEGEETSQEFALMLAGDIPEDWSSVAGLAYKTKDGTPMFHRERPFIPDLDKYRPRWELLPSVERYLIQSGAYDRALPVYISRGCPFRCGFCYNEVVMKRTWRQHSDEFILNQIQWLKDKYGVNAVDYADDYLFGRLRLMMKLVEKVDMPWSGQVRAQLLKPKFVKWMRETGCQWVNIGAESGSQRVLDIITKDQKAWQIEWGVKNLVEHAPDIEANLSFMVGIPGETREDRKVTFDLIERISDFSPNIRCSLCVYMPYPGTPLWPKALEAGYVAPDSQVGWTEFDLNRGNTPWMDDAEAQTMCDVNDILFVGRSQGHWVLKPYYALLRWRWRNMYFQHYWEGAVKRAIMGSPLKPVLRWLTDRLVQFNQKTHKGAVSEGADALGLEPAREA